MKTHINGLLLLSLLAVSAAATADNSGLINFNLGGSPVNDASVQPVTLYGCNTVVNSELFWDSDNQIVGDIPHGWHTSQSGKRYYASQYYLASPPAFRKGSKPSSPKQQPYLGLSTPDSFRFRGVKPAQIVYFDYRILKPTYLTYVPVDYSHPNQHGESCRSLGVEWVAVNTQCNDFPWRNGALGAAGIGAVTPGSERIFLPLLQPDSAPLHCEVTILDDILLEHTAFFVGQDGRRQKTVDLTAYHRHNDTLKLLCEHRPKHETPPGCSP